MKIDMPIWFVLFQFCGWILIAGHLTFNLITFLLMGILTLICSLLLIEF